LKLSKELKIGFVVVLGLVLLLIGVNYLKGKNLFAENSEYYVFYENVDGLTQSNPVMLNGLQVGLVKDVVYEPESGLIKVTITIDNPDIPVTLGTICTIKGDLLGSKRIDLLVKKGASQAEYGDTLVAGLEKSLQESINEQVAPLKRKTEQLISSIDSILITITAFWDENTANNITASVSGARKAINRLEITIGRLDTLVAGQSGKISRILTNVETTTKGLAENTSKISKTIDNVATFSEQLKDVELRTAITKINSAADEIQTMVQKVNRGEGNLGLLIHDDSLYESLLETNASLQLLINDIRNYPSRYLHFSVFGSREKNGKLNSQEEKYLKDLLDMDRGRVIRFDPQQEKKLMDLIK
jgi:phospholipid/cholesterol/gamma-HCH transport system substrate-binding protein